MSTRTETFIVEKSQPGERLDVFLRGGFRRRIALFLGLADGGGCPARRIALYGRRSSGSWLGVAVSLGLCSTNFVKTTPASVSLK